MPPRPRRGFSHRHLFPTFLGWESNIQVAQAGLSGGLAPRLAEGHSPLFPGNHLCVSGVCIQTSLLIRKSHPEDLTLPQSALKDLVSRRSHLWRHWVRA